jgi:hypothetical protein
MRYNIIGAAAVLAFVAGAVFAGPLGVKPPNSGVANPYQYECAAGFNKMNAQGTPGTAPWSYTCITPQISCTGLAVPASPAGINAIHNGRVQFKYTCGAFVEPN